MIKTIPERFAEMGMEDLAICFQELQVLNETGVLPDGLFRSVIREFAQECGNTATSFLTSGEKDLYFEIANRFIQQTYSAEDIIFLSYKRAAMFGPGIGKPAPSEPS